ncbi:MAG: ATP-dependent DNA ligase [Candidatus Marsarchaeota archaeon]|nr:ATP-dependent DNA ligase [Candidatus Marsarchaeota archaeon]
MIDLLSEMLSKASKDEIRALVYFTQGILAPSFEGVETGMAEKMAITSIAMATGFEQKEVESSFRKTGDMGKAAEELAAKTRLRRIGTTKPSVERVFQTMHKIAKTSGQGSKEVKLKLLAGLLAEATPVEARYVVRFALGKLRLGIGDATILEALAKSGTGSREAKTQLEHAYNLCSDLGKVAETLYSEGMRGIESFEAEPFSPIRPALAERANTFEEIMKRMNGRCYAESKYDGLRMQIHLDRKAGRVEIFSRNLERLTEMFPDVARAALDETTAHSAVFEGEAISYDDSSGEFHSFQETIQRKRKHGIEEAAEQFPMHVFTFDLMYLNGKSYIGMEYTGRRAALESMLKEGNIIRLTDRIEARSSPELERYFNTAVGSGLEGIIAKEPGSKYVAGARKFSWIKMKRSYKAELSDTVDLVIIGYYLGRGQRAEFGFGGLLTAVYNKERDAFESITRIGTGFTEEQMVFFRKDLGRSRSRNKPPRVESVLVPDFWVEPLHVIEVRADEITRSPMHTCGKSDYKDQEEQGYALRFPRIVGKGYRDKGPEDATTTHEIVEMFKLQRKKKIDDG